MPQCRNACFHALVPSSIFNKTSVEHVQRRDWCEMNDFPLMDLLLCSWQTLKFSHFPVRAAKGNDRLEIVLVEYERLNYCHHYYWRQKEYTSSLWNLLEKLPSGGPLFLPVTFALRKRSSKREWSLAKVKLMRLVDWLSSVVSWTYTRFGWSSKKKGCDICDESLIVY